MASYTPQQLAEELNLPPWTLHYPEVVARCAVNLAFRCSVCDAKTHQYREVLIREARRLAQTW